MGLVQICTRPIYLLGMNNSCVLKKPRLCTKILIRLFIIYKNDWRTNSCQLQIIRFVKYYKDGSTIINKLIKTVNEYRILNELLCFNLSVCLFHCNSSMSIRDGKPGINEDFLYFPYSPAIVPYFSFTSSLFFFHISLFPLCFCLLPLQFTSTQMFLLSISFLSPPALHFLSLISSPLTCVSFSRSTHTCLFS